ncbi:cytochrome P450 2A11-like [Rhinophrynus dorsalis]
MLLAVSIYRLSLIKYKLYEMFPKIMQYLPGGHTKIFRYLENLMHFVEEKVLMNQKNLDVNNSGSYVDAFLIRMEKERMDPHSEFHMANLVNSTLHIYFAGVETISTSLRYSMLILLKYPDILSKVHEEIDRVIGRNRSPVLQDRNKMPYTDAVIHEVQRYIDLIPMGVPRRTTTDTQLQGYSIPKGTNVFAMLGTVLRDPEHFPYPMEFNPKNFLDEDGQFKKNDAFMPLSAGKRVCLGEGLVRMELFLFFVSILQNFNLKSPVPPQDLDITPDVSGMGNFPKPFKIAFIPR